VIEHEGVGSVVADKHPRIDARVTPAQGLARVRVYFRAAGTPAWYYVTMKPEGELLHGALPRPSKSTKAIDYYIEAVDESFRETRTAEFQPAVVPGAGSCASGRLVAVALASAPVTLGAGAGAPSVPAGFANAGIAGVGGGLSTGALLAVVGGGAAVAGGIAVASSKGGDEEAPTSITPSPPLYSVVFGTSPQNGLDVSVCAGRPLIWASQVVSNVQPDGSFNIVWAPNEPNTLRATGRADSSRFDATLTCASGAGPTGAINATGNGSSYTGTFSFSSSEGSVRITRQ
jgi:hypothetical protein